MRILSHRGYWHIPSEKNTVAAFRRSFTLGFGTETDFRDQGGKLVVSHDPAVGDTLSVDDFFDLYRQTAATALPLALNIKADGLQSLVAEALKKHAIDDYFVFDMAVPDTLGYLKMGLKTFTRHSDIEPDPVLYGQASGIWLDALATEWADQAVLRHHLTQGKDLCIVSPELHHRPHRDFWQTLRGWDLYSHPKLMLCTDIPEEAQAFFYEK